MKKTIIILSSLAAVIAVAVNSSYSNSEAKQETITDEAGFSYTQQQAKHGEYLVAIMGCDDCHSPKVMGPRGPEIDSSRRLSGYRSGTKPAEVDTRSLNSWVMFGMEFTNAVGPWGMSFTANLTSDPTGIGNWTMDNFKTAIRKGKYKGIENGRDLLPPMPWQQYRNLSDEDVKDIFAFLKSTKPVENRVPAPIPPTELNKK